MNEEFRDRLATVEIEICGSDECHKDWVLWKDNADAVLAEIEAAGYVVVERERFFDLEAAELALENCRELYQRDLGTWVRPDKFERVRRFAAAANAVHQHKNDVLGRDTISLPEVEKLNARLDPLYAEMEAAWCALQPGDLGGEGGE